MPDVCRGAAHCLPVSWGCEILIRGSTKYDLVGPPGTETKGERVMTEATGGGRSEMERPEAGTHIPGAWLARVPRGARGT